MNPTSVLVIAGSDSSGGAGIVRDVETIAANDLRACLAVTSVTVQTHDAVERVELCDADLVEAQMRAALRANRVKAIKIGMLGNKMLVERVARVLVAYEDIPVVLDPVIAASSGRALLTDDAVTTMRETLMPRCLLVTPNLPELTILADANPAKEDAEIFDQANGLLAAGVPALLVKGGHGQGARAVDILFRAGSAPLRFEGSRLAGTMRGTGCMMASAIAAGLAKGLPLEDSVRAAKAYVAERWEGS